MTARYCSTCRTVHPRITQATPVEAPTLRDNLILLADLTLSAAVGAGIGYVIFLWLQVM